MTETQYSTSGTSLIERSYSYPAAGEAQPHTLREMTEKTPQGDRLYSYEYDVAGNTTKRTKTGADQTLFWDAEGNLESVTDADGKKTSFLYDVDGSRMLRKEPDATTLYLPEMEIRLDHQSRSTAATRYYSLPGGSTLVRKLDGLRYVANDHHDTGQAAVDEAGVITHRRTTPYGEVRGTESGEWPTEKGFVNGNIDSTTNLINIGAREYDPVAGRFISVDPIINSSDPQQWNAYAYSNNSPITFFDPSGLYFFEGVAGNGLRAYTEDSVGGRKTNPGKRKHGGYRWQGETIYDPIGNSQLSVEPDVENPLTVDEMVNQMECKQTKGPYRVTCTQYSQLPEYKKEGYVKQTLCYNNPKKCKEWQDQENGVVLSVCVEISGQFLIFGAAQSFCGGIDGKGVGAYTQLKAPRAGSIDASPGARLARGDFNIAIGVASGTIRGMHGVCVPGLYAQGGGGWTGGVEVDAAGGYQGALVKAGVGGGAPTAGAHMVCTQVYGTSY